VLDLVLSRQRYLARLATAPAEKRELVEELGDSRSTVDRALRALDDWGLIRRGNDGYELTYTGRVLLDTVEEAQAVASTAAAASAALNEFETTVPRDHRFFAGAEVVTMDDRSPAAVLERMQTVAEEATRLRGAAVAANDEEFIAAIHRRAVVEGHLDATFVVTEQVAAYLAAETPAWARDILTSPAVDLVVVSDLPFAWYLATIDGQTTAYLAIHGARDNFLGYVANDDPDAVAWLVSLFDDQRARGRSLGAYYDDAETAVDPR
jgi:DNA-binding MarR family transcriptional regulator